jgi:hypothetical protein
VSDFVEELFNKIALTIEREIAEPLHNPVELAFAKTNLIPAAI